MSGVEPFQMFFTHIPEIDMPDEHIRSEVEWIVADGRIEQVDWDGLTIDRDPPLDGLPEWVNTSEGRKAILVTVMAVKPSSSGS